MFTIVLVGVSVAQPEVLPYVDGVVLVTRFGEFSGQQQSGFCEGRNRKHMGHPVGVTKQISTH